MLGASYVPHRPRQTLPGVSPPDRPMVGGCGGEKVVDISGPGCSTLDSAIHGINHHPVDKK